MESPTDVVPPPGAQVPPSGPRRLRRRPDDGHIAGVCAGVAEYFDVDPVIVRIAAVFLLISGPGAFAYVLAWIFVPEAPGSAVYGAPRAPVDHKDRATQVFGTVLIVLAVSVFWGDWWSPARHWLLPLGLMALGAWLLLRRADDDVPSSAPPSTPPVPPTAWAWGAATTEVTEPTGPTGPTGPAAPADGDADGDATADDTLPLAGTGDDAAGGEPPTTAWDLPGLTQPPPVPPTPVPQATPSRRRVLGPIVFGALLVWAGLAFLLDVTVETGLAGGLLIIGIGFVLGAFVGGSRVLILPALVVGAALAVTAVVDIPLEGPIGRQGWAPTSLEQLEDTYAVSVGEGTLDLQAIDIPAGERVELAASVGVGHLLVLVPSGATIEVTTDVGAGESDVFGQHQNGLDVTTDQTAAGDADLGTLALDLQVGVGQVEVRRAADVVTTTPTDAPDPTTPSTTLG